MVFRKICLMVGVSEVSVAPTSRSSYAGREQGPGSAFSTALSPAVTFLFFHKENDAEPCFVHLALCRARAELRVPGAFPFSAYRNS